MASTAALQPHPRLRPTTVPPGRPPVEPHLRLVQGGRSAVARARRGVLLRRRVAALAAALVLLATLLLAGSALAGTAGGGTHPSAAAGATSSAAAPGGSYVVQSGDTLWSIAAATSPGIDVRVAVDRLAELNGGAPLVVGQRLLLP